MPKKRQKEERERRQRKRSQGRKMALREEKVGVLLIFMKAKKGIYMKL